MAWAVAVRRGTGDREAVSLESVLEGVPERPVEALPVLRAWGRCGRDANGSYLVAELSTVLDEEGVAEPGERSAWFELADQIDAEQAVIRREQDERRDEELAKLRNR